MKKLALILFMGTLVSFYAHTVRQAANLSVMMVLLVPRKKHALTEV